jgi:hypothetical protein
MDPNRRIQIVVGCSHDSRSGRTCGQSANIDAFWINRIVDAATDAPNLASTLNQRAFNLGNATGAWLGGVALTEGASYQQLPLLGALVAAIALAFTLTTLVNPRVMPVQIRPAE